MSETHHEEVERPTPVPPSFRVAAVASVAGLRDSCGNVPLDSCVPVRLIAPIPTNLGPQSEWLLLHIDGSLSLQEIAVRAEVSLPETIEAYLDLLLRGLVTVNLPETTS